MKKVFYALLFGSIFSFFSCEDIEVEEIKVQEAQESLGYISFMTLGIIDFSTDAYDIDTMYVHYDIGGLQISATYDTLSVSSIFAQLADVYEGVLPGTYNWSGKGVTYAVDTLSFDIVYDTNLVSGQFTISDGDFCIFSISVDDSLKIGKAEKDCL